MKRHIEKRILARVAADDFVGREAELERLLNHAKGKSGSDGLVVLAAPAAGASELLRQTYDRLFFEQKDVVPFYFEVKTADLSGRNAALRFLREFLMQTVAFRRSDASIIAVSPDVCEISELAAPSDSHWIDQMIETCQSSSNLNDDRSLVHNCLSAPMRAAASGARAFVMIDDLHIAAHLDGGEAFLDDILDIFGRASLPFALAGHRRFLFAKTPFETMTVEPLSFEEAGKFAQRLSARMSVAINDQTRDLIAVQLGGNAGYINSLFVSAAAGGSDLNSFEHCQRVYTDEIFGGRIGKFLDKSIGRILPEAATRSRVLRLLSENITAHKGTIPLTYWKKHAGLEDIEFNSALDVLDCHEVINVRAGLVEIDTGNIVLRDYIRAASRLETDGEPRALAIGKSLSENVKRAPQLMARSYRRNSAIGLRELMMTFDGRQVSAALIDYGRFKNEFKGAGDEKILKALKEDNTKVSLPRVVYTAHTAAMYPGLNEFCDAERSAVALGFTGAVEQDEIAWIGAEIDSKLEVTRELAEL